MAVTESKGFTVSARTILELGAELISSDAIALYELIKNAYDAGSKRAVVEVTNVFRFSSLRNQLARIDTAIEGLGGDAQLSEEDLLEKLTAEIVGLVDQTAPVDARNQFITTIRSSASLAELRGRLVEGYQKANLLEIVDTGEGMSMKQLRGVFLTLGTRSRLETAGQRHFVGGKGIGRLSDRKSVV